MEKSDIDILKELGKDIKNLDNSEYWKKRAEFSLSHTTQDREKFPVFDHTSGQGNKLSDLEGNEYLDATSGVAFRAFGFRDSEMVEYEKRLSHVVRELPGQDFDTIPQILLSEKVCEISPGSTNCEVGFTSSGGRAVGAAIKSVISKTGRTRFVAFRPAFHGRTGYSLPFTCTNAQHKNYYPSPVNIVRTPYAYCYQCPFKMDPESCGCYCADYLEDALTREGTDIGAILVEPISGEGGIIVPHKDFLPRLRKTADSLGAYLISDEVQAGMGRTGKWWACENFGITPDYIASAKCFGAGYNLAMTLGPDPMFQEYPIDPKVLEAASPETKKELQDKFIKPKLSRHSQTVSAEPFHALMSLFMIKKIEKSLGNIQKVGTHMLSRLEDFRDKYEIVGDARGIGLMMGIEIVKDKKSRQPDPETRSKIVKACVKNKLIVLGSGKSSIRLLPAYNTTEGEADEILNRLEAGIKSVNPAKPARTSKK